MKKISIITVCYNSESTIRDTIESVISQSYPNIEYIIIDGGSQDSTLNIIKEYKNKIYKYISEADHGIYDAMNKGISVSTGDIVGILNSDDFFYSDSTVADIATAFELNKKVDLVYGDVVFVNSVDTNKVVRFYSSKSFKPYKLRFGWMPPHPASFITRSSYENIGKYSLEYKISSDYEFFVRMLLVHKLNYVRINKIIVNMRVGGVSTSGLKNSWLLNSEIVKACKNNAVYTNIFFILLKLPFKILELIKRPKDIV